MVTSNCLIRLLATLTDLITVDKYIVQKHTLILSHLIIIDNNNFPFETKMGIIKTKYVYLIGAIP